MSEQEIMAGNTESTETQATPEIQEETTKENVRTYTQEEFDNHMAGLKASLTKKLLKPYEELGDINELKSLRDAQEKKIQEEKLRKGEFEKILQETVEKKDSEIRKRDAMIQEFKLEQPLLATASEMRSVNPEQVKRLLRNYVKLNEEGEVEVLDDNGVQRYNDSGKPFQVKDLVKDFLDKNPHFVQSSPATTNSKHSFKNESSKVDISKLDMKNPEHRAIYKEYRKANGIR